MKPQTNDLNNFLSKNVFGDDGSQNMIAYQPLLDMLELKKGQGH